MSSVYPTSALTYLIVKGSHYDPIGKEGLSNVVVEILNRGSYLDSESKTKDIFIELESLGSSLEFGADSDTIVANLRAPKSTFQESESLLKKYLSNVKYDSSSLEKSSKQVLAKYQQMKSESRLWASYNFFKEAFNERNNYGTKQTHKNIKESDVILVLKDFTDNYVRFISTQPDSYEVENIEILKNIDRSFVQNNIEQINYLGGDFKQKVVMSGGMIPAFTKKEKSTKTLMMDHILNAIINDGLSGLAYEYIRRDNSAAYFASGRVVSSPRAKAFLIFAGTSEKTITLVLEQVDRILNQLKNGDIDAERISLAKTSRIGKLINNFDDLSAYLSYVATSFILENPVLTYEETADLLNSITTDEFRDYLITIFTDYSEKIFIAGEVSQKTKAKLSELKNDK